MREYVKDTRSQHLLARSYSTETQIFPNNRGEVISAELGLK